MKHTQGPWHIETHRNSIGAIEWHHIKSLNGTDVVSVGADYLNDEANARLIAAAPDMLEALKMLALSDCECIAEEKPLIRCHVCAARAAIAKATNA